MINSNVACQCKLATLLACALSISVPVLAASTSQAPPLKTVTPAGVYVGQRIGDMRHRVQRTFPKRDDVKLVVNERGGTIRYLRGSSLTPPIAPTTAGILGWLDAHREITGLAHPSVDLALAEAVVTDARTGTTYFHFQQMAFSRPVVGAEFTALLDAEHRLIQLTGTLVPAFADTLQTGPMSSDEAVRIAEAFAERAGRETFSPMQTRRVFFAASDGVRPAHEVWLSFHRDGPTPFSRAIYVDAHTGRVIAAHERVFTASAATCSGVDWTGTNRSLKCASYEGGQRLMVDVATIPGAEIWTTDSLHSENVPGASIVASNTTFFNEPAVNAHFGIWQSYKYMQDVHGRQSWNRASGALNGHVSNVNYGTQYPNAMATVLTSTDGNTQSAFSLFGNGDGVTLSETTRCLDVAGHELFHTVIAATAGLVYQNQSGAMNEHIADAFGTAIDKRYENGDDLIGENCTIAGALRSMANPPLFDQPAMMAEFVHLPNTEDGDHGGVHINSGILNYAYYLFYSTHGIETAEAIWYRALTQGGLTSQSQFADFTRALVTSCDVLSLGASVCGTLDDALATVGLFSDVGSQGACPANAVESGGSCHCVDGFQPNATGTACEAIANAGCPAHSTQYGEYCYCDDGYGADDAGTACVPIHQAACPANAHRIGDTCACDDGFYGDANSFGGACLPEPYDCPPFSVFEPSDQGCYCLLGFDVNDDGTGCVPAASGCGNETFIGRCAESGRYVVYCDEYTNPNNPVVAVLDCHSGDAMCDYNDDQQFYDCVASSTNCGNVDYAGSCDGDELSYCAEEGTASETLVVVDCDDYDGTTCTVVNGDANCRPDGDGDGNDEDDDDDTDDDARGARTDDIDGDDAESSCSSSRVSTGRPSSLLALIGFVVFLARPRRRPLDLTSRSLRSTRISYGSTQRSLRSTRLFTASFAIVLVVGACVTDDDATGVRPPVAAAGTTVVEEHPVEERPVEDHPPVTARDEDDRGDRGNRGDRGDHVRFVRDDVPVDDDKPTPTGSSSSTITLREGESASFTQTSISVALTSVTYVDSPCPTGAACIWSGIKKEAHVVFASGDERISTVLVMGIPIAVFGEDIVIVDMTPQSASLKRLGSQVSERRSVTNEP